jgi:acetyl esterase/lipase
MILTHGVRERDVEYYRHGREPLLARVYQPDAPGVFPSVIEVHGGAWVSGDRFNNAAIARGLAARGIVVVSVDFRMPPAARYPAAVADVNVAIRWLKQHAGELASRPALVGALGTSSGAQTLLLDVLRPRDPRYAALPLPEAPSIDATVGYVVACWPIADPPARYRMARERGNAKLVDAHDAYWPDEAAMAEGSPQRLLDEGTHDALPPLLVIQGTADDNVTPDMADRLVSAYRNACGDATLRTFPGQPHTFIKEPLTAASTEALDLIARFVHEHAARNSLI